MCLYIKESSPVLLALYWFVSGSFILYIILLKSVSFTCKYTDLQETFHGLGFYAWFIYFVHYSIEN